MSKFYMQNIQNLTSDLVVPVSADAGRNTQHSRPSAASGIPQQNLPDLHAGSHPDVIHQHPFADNGKQVFAFPHTQTPASHWFNH